MLMRLIIVLEGLFSNTIRMRKVKWFFIRLCICRRNLTALNEIIQRRNGKCWLLHLHWNTGDISWRARKLRSVQTMNHSNTFVLNAQCLADWHDLLTSLSILILLSYIDLERINKQLMLCRISQGSLENLPILKRMKLGTTGLRG